MKLQNDDYNLRVVKLRQGGSVFFELRCEGSDGIEYHLGSYDRLEEPERHLQTFRGLSPDGKIAAVALYQAMALAGRIAYATDDLGSGLYATKSHMRAWAKEMFDTLGGVSDVLAEISGRRSHAG